MTSLREILDVVGRTHLDAERLDAASLLGAAVAAARREGVEAAPALRDDGGLGERLGPALDDLVEAAPASGRDRFRAVVLDAALRAADRWSRAAFVPRESPHESPRERKAGTRRLARRQDREDGVAVIRPGHLSRATPMDVRDLLAEGAPPSAIVVDLRGNTGGSVLGGAGVVNLFTCAGVIAEVLDRRGRPVPGLRSRVEATPAGDAWTPLAALVDARTGSSAELIAASLAWNDRAIVAGERTFGKTVVGKVHAFPELALSVTITSALMRAAGRELSSDGLEPDVPLPPESAVDRLAAMLTAHGRPSRRETLERLQPP